MRIALGCMRLSTEPDRDEASAMATLHAALDAGFDTLDTAHAYGLGADDLGHNERLVARALRARRERAETTNVRVITKCGMRRDGGAWVPDNRASSILVDARASVDALGGAPLDLLLLHAPERGGSLGTAARALARARAEGLARNVGVSNVTRKQLEEVAAVVTVTAVEVALGAYDDLAIRNGVAAYCIEHGIELLAHAPLGGPRRVGRLAHDATLRRIAEARGGHTPIEVFLAYLLAVRPEIVPVVGVRRPETVASLVRAAQLTLDELELAAIDARFPGLGSLRRPLQPPTSAHATSREVVILMGVPGAGKSRAAQAYVARGYERLNRDTLGGTLRGIVQRLDERLRDGAERIVLDNTYVTRATRHDVLRKANAHGVPVRCVFFDTPQHEANINVVNRMLERFGKLIGPTDIGVPAELDPAAPPPSAVQRMTRDLEPPADDEGFAAIEIVTFVRAHGSTGDRASIAIALDGLKALMGSAQDMARLAAMVKELAGDAEPPVVLLYGWRPTLAEATRDLAARVARQLVRVTGDAVDVSICRHPVGPVVCWCRPPLPGLWLAFARRHGVDVRRSVLLGARTTDAAMARALGLTYVRHDDA